MTTATTRAARLLSYYTETPETSESANWGETAAGVGLRAGILAGIFTGGHYIDKHFQRKNLQKLGYVNHPHDTNIMVHPPTGKMFHLGRGMPIN